MTDLTGNVIFDGPAGRLEGILKEGIQPVSRAAVVCHPHPLFGGTMHNKVVYRLARAFSRAGFTVLRFNFRGAGRSEGQHDDGRGEQDDLRAAMSFIEQSYPGAELWLAGFSFGASAVGRVACSDPRVRSFIVAGLPVSRHSFDELENCVKPKLFIQGALDQFGLVEDLEKVVARVEGPKQLAVIEGADHFFEGQLDRMEAAAYEFIAQGSRLDSTRSESNP